MLRSEQEDAFPYRVRAAAEKADYGIDPQWHGPFRTKKRAASTNHPIYFGQIVVKWRTRRVMRARPDAGPFLHAAMCRISISRRGNLTPLRACRRAGAEDVGLLMGIIFLARVFRLLFHLSCVAHKKRL